MVVGHPLGRLSRPRSPRLRHAPDPSSIPEAAAGPPQGGTGNGLGHSRPTFRPIDARAARVQSGWGGVGAQHGAPPGPAGGV